MSTSQDNTAHKIHGRKTVVSASQANDYLGRKVGGEWLITVYADSTRKGVGSALKRQMLAWAKWFRSQGATSVKLITKRAQYHYGHGNHALGTYWTMRVVAA